MCSIQLTRIIQRPLSAIATRVNVAKHDITTGLFGLRYNLIIRAHITADRYGIRSLSRQTLHVSYDRGHERRQ
jgi:hypothetical protein